jgi:hypothetical protein
MFDFIQCEYPLPLGDHVKELKCVPDWEEFEFQTKDLESILNNYVISEDGQLYMEEVEFELSIETHKWHPFSKKEVKGIERLDFTGEINIYGIHLDEEYDFWIELKALFWKGDLKELELERWTKEDNTERIAFKKELDKQIEEFKTNSKKRWPKLKYVYTSVVRSIFHFVRGLFGIAVKITWKIEKWIS